MDKTAEQVLEMVRQASPQLWSAAQSKVIASITLAYFWANAGAVVALIGVVLLVVAFLKRDDYSETSMGFTVLGVCSLLLGALIAGINYTDYWQMNMAREWYVIDALSRLSPLR